MKTITGIGIAIAAIAVGATGATAQRFGGGVRTAPTVTYRPPAPVYRAPAPAPAYVQRAPAVTNRLPTPAARLVPAAKPRPPLGVTRPVSGSGARVESVRAPKGRPARSTFRHAGRSYTWTTPAVMPVWWMAAMNQPYSVNAYERFIQRCIRTPRDRRSRECVRALRERGITA